MKEVSINENKFKGFIVTGSSDCTIKSSTVLKFDTKTEEVINFKVISTVILNADVTVDNVLVKNIPICIAPDDLQVLDVIIGRTFSEHSKVEYRRNTEYTIFCEELRSTKSKIEHACSVLFKSMTK